MTGSPGDPRMIDVSLSRIVIREGSEQQYIFLQEPGGGRGFPIVSAPRKRARSDAWSRACRLRVR
jgi:hypothetical protein